mgnify:CR=1 FL=1
MTEQERWQRLRELNDAMKAKRRYDQPPDAEQWIFGYEDVDDDEGRTLRRGIPMWTPRAESDEWHQLRFGPSWHRGDTNDQASGR